MNRHHQLTWVIGDEASVQTSMDIDGEGIFDVACGHKTLDHFLETFARYGRFDLKISVQGDSILHHTFEQTGVALGLALDACLGDRKDTQQFATACIPVDKTVAEVVVDIHHNPGGFYFKNPFFELSDHHDGVEVSCYVHLLEKMAIYGNINVHVLTLYAEDVHHAIETLFKAVAVAIHEASRVAQKPIPRLPREVKS